MKITNGLDKNGSNNTLFKSECMQKSLIHNAQHGKAIIKHTVLSCLNNVLLYESSLIRKYGTPANKIIDDAKRQYSGVNIDTQDIVKSAVYRVKFVIFSKPNAFFARNRKLVL